MRRKRKKIIEGIMIALMAGLIIFSGVKLLQYFEEKERVEEQFNALTRMTDTENNSRKSEDEEGKSRLEKYRKLYELNPDFIGWLRIEGTNIDYPVMQSGTNDPEFYLDHDFNKEYSVYGVPFADAACRIGESNNVILYGHHMTSETMFHEITYYADPEFLKDHKRIIFPSPIKVAPMGTNIEKYNQPSEDWLNDVEIFYNKYLKEHALGSRIQTLLFHRNLDAFSKVTSCLRSISQDQDFIDKMSGVSTVMVPSYQAKSLPEYDVFLSHANKDKEDYVEELYKSLDKLDVKIFYDKESLKWGDNWKQRRAFQGQISRICVRSILHIQTARHCLAN